jgi:hypothetical protein
MGIHFELLSFSGILIIINFVLATVIEIDNELLFAYKRENYYKRSSDINKEYIRMKLIIYT